MANFFARARVYVLIASLALIGQTSRAASPAELIKTFRTTTDAAVRAQARQEIVKAGPDAVPALIAEMAHNARGRDRMREMLQAIGTPAAPKLLDLTSDKELAPWAASALFWVVGQNDDAVMPRLIECMEREDIGRSCADAMLRAAGTKSKKRAPALVKLLKSKNPETRVYACAGLERFGNSSKDVLTALEAAAQDENAAVKKAADQALRRLRG